jgi:uncharacterized protein (DUF433 family)
MIMSMRLQRTETMRRQLAPHIVSDPETMGGVPIVQGTRMPVYIIIENLEAGHSIDEILLDYPTLTRETIQAAIHYAAELTTTGAAVENPSR